MTKQELDEIMQISGNVRGAILQTHAVYIEHKKGKEGIEKLEKKLKELGHPLEFEKIDPLDWYPEAISTLIMVLTKEVFNWTDKDIFDMGNFAPKSSFIVKMFITHFLSPKKCFEQFPEHWRKNCDFGEAQACEFNEKEKYTILRLKSPQSHPVICVYHAGYFLRGAQLVIKSKNITIKETTCAYKGDPYHEYTIRWE